MKIQELIPVFVDQIPDVIEEGNLYITEKYGIAIHLCACGCKQKTVTGLKPRWHDGWDFINNNGKITLSPSIGNFAGEVPYHAHYYVKDNHIEPC